MEDHAAGWGRFLNLRFESCVIPEGSQTVAKSSAVSSVFESCVIPEGSQTKIDTNDNYSLFESCVIPEGSQTSVAL